MSYTTNWRAIAAGKFISKRDGSNANAGTKAAPYETLQKGLSTNGNNYIRNGFYLEGDFLIGDGDTLVEGDGLPEWNAEPFASAWVQAPLVGNYENEIKGFLLRKWANVSSSDKVNFAFNNVEAYECNLRLHKASSYNLFSDCYILRDNGFTNAVAAFGDVEKSTFINTIIQHTFSLIFGQGKYIECVFNNISSMINNASTFPFQRCAFEDNGIDGFTIDGLRLVTKTLQGDANPIGLQYSNGEKFSGTFFTPGGSISFIDCFWSPSMGWNSPANGDYTLNHLPLSKLFNSGNQIGAYNIHYYIDSNHPAYLVANGASYTNIEKNVDGSFTISLGFNVGVIESTLNPIFAFALPQLTTISEAVKFIIDSSPVIGEGLDTNNYPTNTRYDYELVYYDESEPNGLNNMLNWSPWVLLEANSPASTDNLDIGNGHLDVDFTTVSPLTFRRFALRITLRTNGVQ